MPRTSSVAPTLPSTSGPADREFEFMLAELDNERDVINERQRRLEQAVQFYLTILTALIAAIVLALTSQAVQAAAPIAAASAMIAAVAGQATFVQIVGRNVQIAASHAHFHLRRQYFLDKYPSSRIYVEYRTNDEIRANWRQMFSHNVTLYLLLFASFIGLAFAAAILLGINAIEASRASYHLTPGSAVQQSARAIAFLVAPVIFALDVSYTLRGRRSAARLTAKIFGDVHVGVNRPASK